MSPSPTKPTLLITTPPTMVVRMANSPEKQIHVSPGASRDILYSMLSKIHLISISPACRGKPERTYPPRRSSGLRLRLHQSKPITNDIRACFKTPLWGQASKQEATASPSGSKVVQSVPAT
jgi:hypothetical protein